MLKLGRSECDIDFCILLVGWFGVSFCRFVSFSVVICGVVRGL